MRESVIKATATELIKATVALKPDDPKELWRILQDYVTTLRSVNQSEIFFSVPRNAMTT